MDLTELKQSRINIWNSVDRTRLSYLRWATNKARKALKAQVKEVVDLIKNDFNNFSESAIDSLIQEHHIKDLLQTIYFNVGKKFSKSVYNGVRKLKDFEFTPVTNVMLVGDFFDDTWLGKVNAILEAEGAALIVAVTNKTKVEIKSILQKGVESGKPIQEMAANIVKDIGGITEKRAITIARTEVIRASNVGAMAGAEMTGLSLNKEWIPTLDGRTRTLDTGPFDHLAMYKKVVDFNEPFNVNGELLNQPCDFGGSAANVINCRCAVAFIKK